MTRRTVYGHSFGENGWPMVNPDGCEWVDVPGVNVQLQLQKGLPLQILRAFAADFNAHVEPLRNPDSAGWTATNSVATSNHLSGTAVDLNWNGQDGQTFRLHNPEHVNFPPPSNERVKELLEFYEGMVFWGQRWSIQDGMHFQMGGGTYGNPRTQDFVDRKIRADGFSTFRRGQQVSVPADSAAKVLADATGLSVERAAEILPTVRQGLTLSECVNPNRIAMWLAQMGHESAGFKATEEYASGAAYEGRKDLGNVQAGDGVRFKGRTWIQITGRHNYGKFSQWCAENGLVNSPTEFVDRPDSLGELRWAGIGPAWYWTVARPDINSLSDAMDLYGVTRRINGGTNGIIDRRNRYDRARDVGGRLLVLLSGEDDLLADPTIIAKIDEIHAVLFTRNESQSIYATPGGGPRWLLPELIKNGDGMVHQFDVENQAKAGDLNELARVVLVARGEGRVTAQWAVDRARRVLAEIEAAKPEVLQKFLESKGK